IFAPWRIIPSRSTFVPIINPGTSTKNSKGILKASQSWINLAALSAESGNSTPPFTRGWLDRKSTRLNSSHVSISYAVFCLKKKKIDNLEMTGTREDHINVVKTYG